MSDWESKTWGDVLSLQRGYDITRAHQVLDGRIPVVSSGGIASFHDTAIACGPGVVIGRKGTLGRVHYVSGDYWPHDTTLWVTDFKGSEPKFIYYALSGLDPTHLNVGSASPTLNRNHVYPLPVTWPPPSEQRAIVEVLGALDDKIAANDRVVVTADELARAEWLAAVSGEETRSLSSMARFVNGKAFTKGASGTGRVVIRIAELNSGLGGSTVYNDIDVADDHLARPGDLLFAWSGSLTAARWYRDEGIVNQHIFKCVPIEGLSIAVVNQALRSGLTIFKGIAADKATTMGHIQRKHLDLEVLVPVDDRLTEVMPRLDALWSAALAAERESLALARTRGALLPLLMSGKLRVKDLEHEITEVL